MDFALKNVEYVANAINLVIERNKNGNILIRTKQIKKICNIDPENRSKTNFIWRSLEKLEHEGILELNGSTRPKTYKVSINGKIDVPQLILRLKCKNKEVNRSLND